MAMSLTTDERLVLQYLASGRSIEEITATLNWPLEAVRWTCTYPLTAWVLDELEASTTTPADPGAGEVSQGRAIVDYIARRGARRAARASGRPVSRRDPEPAPDARRDSTSSSEDERAERGLGVELPPEAPP